jgi:TRAP-type C4-dicarboxylate transport system substrate-binding protein
VQKNLTLTGHVYSPALILMNKAQWEKLSDADKQAFLARCQGSGEGQPRTKSMTTSAKPSPTCARREWSLSKTSTRPSSRRVLAPVYVDFAKRFGQDNIDRI